MFLAADLAVFLRKGSGKPLLCQLGILGLLVWLLICTPTAVHGATTALPSTVSPQEATLFSSPTVSLLKASQPGPPGQGHAQKKIRVGYCVGYGVLSSVGENSYTGYGYDYLVEIAKHTGWEYEFVPVGWKEGMYLLATGGIDLFGPMQKTPERQKIYDFPQRQMGYEYGLLYARDTDRSMHYDDFEQFDAMRVGVVEGSFFNGPFENFRERNRFTVKNVNFPDNESALEGLLRGDVDTIIISNISSVRNTKLVARFAAEPFYFAALKGRPDIICDLDAALDAIHSDDVYFDANLYARYFRYSLVNQPAFTRAERSYLQHGRTLRMAILQNHPPLEYVDNDGQPRGIVYDIMRRVAEKNDIPLDFVSVPTYAAAMEGIRAGSIDALAAYGVMDGGFAVNDLKITAPYMSLPMVLVGRKGQTSASRKIIALPESYASLQELANTQYPGAVVTNLPTLMDCLKAVQSGTADFTLVSSYLFDRVAADPDYRNLHILSMVNRPFALSVAASADVPAVALAALNKALARLTPRDLGEIVLAGTAREPVAPSIRVLLTQYPREILVVLCLVAMIGTGVYMRLCQQTERRLWDMAYTDNLTGYTNWYKLALDADSLRQRRSFAFVVMDIDGFKMVNEYFGYAVGNRALLHMAEVIHTSLQPGEVAARRDGDVFCMLLHWTSEAALVTRLLDIQARIVALRLNETDEGRILHTVCGVCVDTDPTITLSSLYDRANHARKTLKPAHSNACAFYDSRLHARVLWEQKIEQHMEQALRDGEFQVCYQPKYDLYTESIIGAEALVRWHHPQSGLIQPMSFIPLFEKNGFILKLDMYMLEQVCKVLRTWMDAGLHPLPVAVNISKVHVHTVNFVRNVREMVADYNVPPSLLELEVTESAFFDNTSALLAAMRELSAAGFTLSLDDFGSGYSSLNMLKNLPVDVLKLDRDFFDMGESEERAQLIIGSVIRMAKALHMRVVSEGVETKAQVDFLRRAGCDYAQGFYYSTPITLAEYERKIF